MQGKGLAMATKTIERPAGAGAKDVYVQVGAFLTAQRLSPDPRNYAIAYEVIVNPGGVMARGIDFLKLAGGAVSLATRVTMPSQPSSLPR